MRPILLVDDSPQDTEMTLAVFHEHHLTDKITALRDGAEALDYLFRRGAFAARDDRDPAVILLDLKMPRVDGLEVLRQVKADAVLRQIPVVVMTSSREDRDLQRSYELGANAYVVKPLDYAQFVAAVRLVGAFWLVLNELPAGGPAPQPIAASAP